MNPRLAQQLVNAKEKRKHHLRVPVLQEERQIIERQAKQAGMSVARYLREVGQGYPINSIVDDEQVRELAR
ncbi:plasmid mobilization protein, partial [Thiolapillus sp.]